MFWAEMFRELFLFFCGGGGGGVCSFLEWVGGDVVAYGGKGVVGSPRICKS